jgi:hypothetical protein
MHIRSEDMHSLCRRTRLIIEHYWAEMETRSVQDGGKLKDQTDETRI